MNKCRKYLLIFVSVAIIATLLVGSIIYYVNVENAADDLPHSYPTNQNLPSSSSPIANNSLVPLLVDATQLTSSNVTVADGSSIDLNMTFALPSQAMEETTVTLKASGLFRTASNFNLTVVPDEIQLNPGETKITTLKIQASEDAELGTYDMDLSYSSSSPTVIGGHTAFTLTVTHSAIPDAAFINYWLDTNQSYQRTGDHSIALNCKNNGDASGAFDIIATCINASFSTDSEQQYQIINGTAVRIPFALNAGEALSAQLHFLISNTADRFSISLQLEGNQSNLFVEPPTSAGGMVPYVIKMRSIEYYWSDSSDSFAPSVPI